MQLGPKPLAQSNRARCLRLADFDLGFNPAHIVEDSFSSLLLFKVRDPIGCYELKQVVYVSAIVLVCLAP